MRKGRRRTYQKRLKVGLTNEVHPILDEIHHHAAPKREVNRRAAWRTWRKAHLAWPVECEVRLLRFHPIWRGQSRRVKIRRWRRRRWWRARAVLLQGRGRWRRCIDLVRQHRANILNGHVLATHARRAARETGAHCIVQVAHGERRACQADDDHRREADAK